MAVSVYDAIVRFIGDMTGVDASLNGVQAKAGAAGTASGKSFGAAMGVAVRTVAGAAVGAAFGIMSQQATALDAATQKLAADTGLSGDALAQQGAAIDNLYKSSLQSMDSIETTLAQVISGFDLTGQAADDLAQKFLDYETATGQSADAVQAMKMVTDAWNLSAADEGTLMDQLVASHQKYGTVIGNMQSALQKIAPAMQAMGMSEKDGVDLLNLFASAGIDASKAAMGLQTAVKALKPGQNLNDLILQISSIQDPLARAQEAGKVFGTRLGSQMALALQPGVTSLDQYATSVTDTANATTKAADAIKDDFGNQVQLVLHQIGGALATVGQDFLPVMLMGSMFGPKMLAAMGGITSAIVPMFTGLGAASGAAEGTAAAEAASAAEVATKQQLAAGDVAAVEAVKGPLEVEAAAAEGTAAGEAFAGVSVGGGLLGGGMAAALIVALPLAVAVGLAAAEPSVEKWWNSLSWPNIPIPKLYSFDNGPATPAKPSDWSTNTGSAGDAADKGATAAADAQAKKDAAVAAQLSADKTLIAQAATDGYSGIPTAAQAASFEANLKIENGLDADVKTIQSKRSALASAWTDAFSTTTDAATIAYREQSGLADIADTQKQLADKKAYAKLTTQQKDALHEQLITQQAAYAQLLVEDTNYGTTAEKETKMAALLQSKALKDGLASADPDTVTMWEKVQADTQTQLDVLNGIMNTGGANSAAAFLAAFEAGINNGTSTAFILTGVTLTTATSSTGGKPPTASAPITYGGGGKPGSSTSKPVTTYGPTSPTNDPSRNPNSFDVGTPFVAYDQLAYVHRGEKITPADQNKPGVGGQVINVGGVTLNGIGSDVSVSAARRFAQDVTDEIAVAMQRQGSRFSEYRGSRP